MTHVLWLSTMIILFDECSLRYRFSTFGWSHFWLIHIYPVHELNMHAVTLHRRLNPNNIMHNIYIHTSFSVDRLSAMLLRKFYYYCYYADNHFNYYFIVLVSNQKQWVSNGSTTEMITKSHL